MEQPFDISEVPIADDGTTVSSIKLVRKGNELAVEIRVPTRIRDEKGIQVLLSRLLSVASREVWSVEIMDDDEILKLWNNLLISET